MSRLDMIIEDEELRLNKLRNDTDVMRGQSEALAEMIEENKASIRDRVDCLSRLKAARGGQLR